LVADDKDVCIRVDNGVIVTTSGRMLMLQVMCVRESQRLACSSTGTVANHAGAVAAIVDICAELDHAHERLAATPAAAELRGRHGAAS
jgi:hypothetical protein